MCNIAGYIGTREATPILLEMIQAQEGLNGGFYSGLAVHDGKNLRYCKLRGDFALLQETYPMETYTGTTGIIHSRTPSGGGDLWAHPFVAPSDTDIRLCYVANGSFGRYADRKESYNAIADALVAEGYDIPCKTDEFSSKYNRLSSGQCVHISDVVCQTIYKYTQTGMATADAMAQAFQDLPHEVVGLAIRKEFPDKIFFARINMPMFVAFDETGAYLASSPTAFAPHITSFQLLPALSSGIIYQDHIEVTPFPNFPDTVRRFTCKTIEKATRIILERLEQGECDFVDLRKAVEAILPQDRLIQSAPVAYMAIYRLLQRNSIYLRKTEKTVGGQTAPAIRFRAI